MLYVYAHKCNALGGQKVALAFSGAGIMCGCEPPDASAGIQTQSFERTIHSLYLSTMSPCPFRYKNLYLESKFFRQFSLM